MRRKKIPQKLISVDFGAIIIEKIINLCFADLLQFNAYSSFKKVE